VKALADGEHGVMIGVRGEEVRRVPLEEVVGKGARWIETCTN
jgi:hypothetical protein